MKILVADDDSRSRELTREILQAQGYQVAEACDGRQALEALAEALPDLVLLDIQLPFVDGFAVLRQLRQHPGGAAVPVIALTARAMRGDREKVLAAGFDAYISKPVDRRRLTKEIERLVQAKLSGGRREGDSSPPGRR